MAMPFDNAQQQDARTQYGQCQGPDTQVLGLGLHRRVKSPLEWNAYGPRTFLVPYPAGHSDPTRNSATLHRSHTGTRGYVCLGRSDFFFFF